MNKKIISLILVLIIAVSICSIPALGADNTAPPKPVYFYVSFWSIDSSGTENIVPLSDTGEYSTWEETLASVKSYDVSGYKDYRFGIMYGINIASIYEINSDIVLPDNTYLILGNVKITKSVAIKGGKNSLLVVTEWCEFANGGTVTNVVGTVEQYIQYEWNITSQKWAKNQNNSSNNPFPTYIVPNTQTTTNDTADDKSIAPEKVYNDNTTETDDKISSDDSVVIDNPFKDIKKSDWFYDDVMYVYSHKLMGSTSTEAMLFSPNMPLTRGMIVTVLYRLVGSPDVSGLTNPFTDVAGNTWYTDAVKWAVENKIVNGYGNGKFGPDDNIIRQDMAVILMRYMSFIKYEYVVTEEYRVFADEDKIDDYAKNAVQVLNKLGIINGKGNGIIDPKGMATRAEVAVMLHRFLVGLNT